MPNYEAYTKEELIKELQSLRRLHNELRQTFYDTEQMEFSWSGSLGQWFWDFKEDEMTFNPIMATNLGYGVDELPERVPFRYFMEKLPEDDYLEVMDDLNNHLSGNTPVWEVKYRIQTKDGSYRVYHDLGKVIERSESGEPLFLKGIVFDITEDIEAVAKLEEKNHLLRHRVKTDDLTSLFSRSVLMVELAKLMNWAKREQQTFSLLKIRIDDFEKYEKNYGIILTEEVVKDLAGIIKEVIHDDHIAGRFRETVFMVLMRGSSKEEAFQIAEQIREKVARTFFTIPEKIHISTGITDYQQNETVSELIEKTGEKVLMAQSAGGNQTVI